MGLLKLEVLLSMSLKNGGSHKRKNKTKILKRIFSVNPPNVYGFGHKEFYEYAEDKFNDESLNYIDGYENKSLKLINAIYLSASEGRVVKMSENPVFSKLEQMNNLTNYYIHPLSDVNSKDIAGVNTKGGNFVWCAKEQ